MASWHCGTCGKDLTIHSNLFECRSHFVKDLREAEEQLAILQGKWKDQRHAEKVVRDALRERLAALEKAAEEYHLENGTCQWGYDLGKRCPLCTILYPEANKGKK